MNSKERFVTIGNISVRVRKKRTRCLRLSLRRSGEVTLHIPWYVPYRAGILFLEEKKSWLEKKHKEFLALPKTLLDTGSKEEYLKLRDQAHQMISARLDHFSRLYGLSFRSLSIRNQKTRWGSCSKGGRGSFNYRLLLLPASFRDYVIVHELCHLEEFNHSPKFWRLVEKTIPDYQVRRKALRGQERENDLTRNHFSD